LREELRNESCVAEMVPSALSDFGAIVRIKEKLAGKFRILLFSFPPKANEKYLTELRNDNVHQLRRRFEINEKHTTLTLEGKIRATYLHGLFQF